MNDSLRSVATGLPILAWLVLILSWSGMGSIFVTGLVLVGVIIAAVHHAETVAHRVGEPFGSLILAVAVTVIEVGLIVSLMLANEEAAATLARDTVFAACMIILNLLLGLSLIAAARHQKEGRFTRTGATAALSTLATLVVLTLILPNYTTSVSGPAYSATQIAFVASFSLLLYLTFVFIQTVQNRDYFLPKSREKEPDVHAEPPSLSVTWVAFAALVVSLGAIVLMAKSLSGPLESAVAFAGAPRALVGVAIAAIVLLPESVAAVRAANANRLQTSLNLGLGSALATIGLTIPAVTVTSFVLGLPLSLGLDGKGIVLLALTLFISALSLARGRTTVLHGAVHIAIFAAYLLTMILP